jgi:hypothetical protein
VGRPGLHQSGLTSLCFVGCFSPGPRKNDLTIYWALGPFVRSFTPLVDPGDIYPPQSVLGFLLHTPRDPFYSPKAARSRWRPTRKAILAFCRVAHRTVRCTTGQPLFMSGARSPSFSSEVDRCRDVAVGAPDTVRCTPDSPVPPADRWRGLRVARGLRGRPLRWRPLAHRTIR